MSPASSKSGTAFFSNLGISLAVTLLVLLFTQDVFFVFPPLHRLELSLIDLRFQKRGALLSLHDSTQVVIVEISQESFKSLPESWPFPKSYYTRLIRNLKRAGAKAVGLDLIFSSIDRRSPQADQEFRKALEETGNVVLAGKLETERRLYLSKAHGENYGNLFLDSAKTFGLVNILTDQDGVLRRYMPFIYDSAQGTSIPTFSMAVLNKYYSKPPSYVADVADHHFQYLGSDIPRYDNSSFLINYYGQSGTFRRIKFADVLDDKDFRTLEEDSLGIDINTFDDTTRIPSFDGTTMVPSGYLYNGTFAGKIVLVGSTMPEEKDLFTVPIGEGREEGDNQMYGVEIHANIVQNILWKNFIIREPFWITVLVVFGLSLFTFVYTAGLKAIKTKFSAAIEILGFAILLSELFIVYWASLKLFISNNYLTDMMSPLMAIIVCYVASTVYNYVTERKQKFLIKDMFSRYVNPTVVDELVAHPEKMQLGGERKELTVFFSDIENFTSISEKLEPEYLVGIMNEYLSEMTSIIFRNDGTLDKYEGDAIVAFWGAPIPQGDHAVRACRTAVEMQNALRRLRERWAGEGKPNIKTRIGISTGDMIVGNMGGATRFDYTVIGDCVNLGSRLETANKQYRTSIMISESTYHHVKNDVIARELDMIVVSGKTAPIRVYEVIEMRDGALPADKKEFIEIYSKGLSLYRKRDWSAAIRHFEEALSIRPDDYPSHMYIERSDLYLSSPPPDDWNGVFILRTK